jgi:Flp pilus assembly protein TadD
MNFRLILTSLLLIVFTATPLFGVLPPEDTKKARKIWLTGYDYFEKGDEALKGGQLRKANTLFQESIKRFNEIKSKYPGWSSSMIEYRLKLCKAKLENVEQLLASKNIKITDSDVDHENLELRNKIKQIQEELKLAKRKLSITLRSLDAARKEAARGINSSGDMEKIIKEKADLEKRYALLADRLKKMEIDSSAHPTAVSDEMKKSLDVALLKLEELSKNNQELTEKLKKEQEHVTRLAKEDANLKYEYKVLEEKNSATVKEVDKLNGKIAENNEIIARWDKDRKDFEATILALEEKLKSSKKSEDILKSKLDEIRKSDTSDTIIGQLKNENELLAKDIELVRLQLTKEIKAKSMLIEEKKVVEERLARVEKSIASAVQEKEKSSSDLKMFKEKLAINDAIIKKQDIALAEEKSKNEKLSKELTALADKYKNIDKKEREFTALAKESLEVENKNRSLHRELKELKKENKEITEKMKLSESKMIQMQKDLQDLISQNAKLEKGSIIAQDKLQEKLTNATQENIKLTATLNTNAKKISMLTEELVTVNTMLDKKNKEITDFRKEIALLKKDTISKRAVKEPQLESKAPEYEELKEENTRMSRKLQEMTQEIAKLKQEAVKEVSAPPPPRKKPNPAKIKKMVASALNAENNNKKEAASWYYEKVLSMDPKNNTALTRLGHIKADNGDYDEAVELILKGLENDPNSVEKLQTLTVCYIRQNQFYKALATAAKANAHAPKDPKIQRFLGIICTHLGWKKAAENLFRSSFKLDPTSPETAFNAAVLLASNKKRIKEARLWYKKAIHLGAERDPGIEKVLKTAK